MITAQEARELAGPTAEELVTDLGPLIEKTAKEKQRSIHLHDNFWVNEAYSDTPKYKEAKKILESLGYKVEFYYRESQFVDMYTIISW